MVSAGPAELHEFCFKQKLRQESKRVSITRDYYWWKLRRNIRQALKRRPTPPGLIVDVGTGHGVATRLAYDCFGSQFEYLAIDFSALDLAIADAVFQTLGIPARTRVGDVTQTLPVDDGKASMVISSEVLEHIPEPQTLLNEVWRILKPGGLAIFTTPNPCNPLVKPLKRGNATYQNCDQADRDTPGYGHVSVLGRAEWDERFKRSGFELLEVHRGALLFGKDSYERSPLTVALYILLDAVLDWLPGTKDVSENLCYVVRRVDQTRIIAPPQ